MLAPPTFGNDERDRTARILNIVLLSLTFILVFVFLLSVFFGYVQVTQALLITLAVALVIYWLMKRGNLTAASTLLLTTLLVLEIYLLYIGKGVNDIAIIIYPIIIVLGSLLLDKQLLFVLLLVIVASIGFITVTNTPTENDTLNDFLVLTMLLTFVTVTMRLISRDLNRVIRKSKAQEEHLKDVNFQLQQQSEMAQLSEARWRSLVENAPDVIMNLNRDGIIQSINTQETSQLVGKNALDFLVGDSQGTLTQAIETVFSQCQSVTFEAQGYSQDKELRWYALRLGPVVQDGQVTSTTLIARDITKSKNAEAALEQSEEMYRSVVENSLAAIFIINNVYQYTYVNDEMCQMMGYTQDELLGLDFRTVLTKESLQLAEDRYIRRQRGEEVPSRYEISVYRKDGERRYMELTAVVVKDTAGTPRSMGQMIDITERKRAEEAMQQYADELVRSNRELQNFAYVASHDLQEPLRKIQTFSSRLQSIESQNLSKRGIDYLVRIENAAGRMQTLIKDLLNYSRVTTHARPFQTINLSEIVDDVLSDIEVRIQTTNAQIEIESLPTIEADPTQMRQLFQNLVSNALKFHNNGRPPVVNISSTTHPDNNSTIIRVADNGIGFEEKHLERIFGVFQRLHNRNEFEGTGVGLAVCRRVVERHNGTITAQSTPGQGATFIITLPLQQSVGD